MKVKPSILEAKFGDGYSQRAANGLNTALEIWNIQATPLKNASEADAFEAFLRTQSGVIAFQWTTPFTRTALFVCKDWQRTPLAAGTSSITATFEEVMA
jgi:phage-related protein